MTPSEMVSAQVVFRPTRGQALDRTAVITAENVAAFTPPQSFVDAATKLFLERGFQATSLVGNSLTITAPPDVFEQVFGLQLTQSEETGVMFVDEKGNTRHELPRKRLPVEIRDMVETVAFVPPPDFGPAYFS